MEDPPLGPLERRVMERLWRSGPATVREVLDALNAASPDPLAYTTVMTTLARLHEKGYLTRTQDGRRFRYAAAVDEASLATIAGRRELQRLIDRHGAATVAAFAADLSSAEPDLVARLRHLARQAEERPR